jgi:predicted nucleic-acid-binding protein
MIGLDTNVLVRYIVEDDPSQAELARKVIEEQCSADDPACINLMVLCELVWVLERLYRCSRAQINEVLHNLLLTECFLVEHHDIAWQAFRDFGNSNADYADCLISRLNHYNGSVTTLTFDKKAAGLSCSTLLTKAWVSASK